MKSGKLTVSEKYIIQHMLDEEKSVGDIAKFLERSETVIHKYKDVELAKIHDTVKSVRVTTEQKTKDPNKPTVGDMMGHSSNSGLRDGVTILTKAATERADDFKENVKFKSRVVRDNVFVPNPKKRTQ